MRAAWRLAGATAAGRGRAGRALSQAGTGTGGGGGGAEGGGSGSGSREAVERLVRAHPVVVFMKGSPAQPLCGFSNAVVQILRLHGVEDYRAHDVLQDPDLRQGQRWAGARGHLRAQPLGLAHSLRRSRASPREAEACVSLGRGARVGVALTLLGCRGVIAAPPTSRWRTPHTPSLCSLPWVFCFALFLLRSISRPKSQGLGVYRI